MESGLSQHVVLVTGASGGIGRALTEAFAGEDCSLVLLANRSLKSLESWVADQPFADRALALKADVTDAEGLAAAVDAGAERFGRIDVAIANAGIWPPADEPLVDMPLERLRRTLDVNLLGAAYTARAFLSVLRRTGPRDDGHGASLIFTGSTAGAFGRAAALRLRRLEGRAGRTRAEPQARDRRPRSLRPRQHDPARLER